MKKFQILGVSLIAVFAIGVVVAASASAAVTFLLAEWLVGGSAVTTELSVDAEGELLLEDTKVPIIGKVAVLCSGILEGTINSNGKDETKELLNLAGEAISLTALSGLALSCTSETGPCTGIEVWAINLPWPTDLELMVEGTESFFADLILMKGEANPGWAVFCKNLSVEDICEALEGVSQKTNEGSNVDTNFTEAFTELAELKLGSCTQGGVESAIVEGLGTILLVEGGTLAVSSE
jgi:hypothetical protein